MSKPAKLPRWTTLEKDRQGKTIYRVRVPYEGNSVRCGTYSSVAVVRTVVDRIEKELADGTFNPDDHQSPKRATANPEARLLGEVIDQYMANQLHLQPSSRNTYWTAANKIKEAIGNILWSEVKRDHFEVLLRKAQKAEGAMAVITLDEDGDLTESETRRGRPVSTGGGVDTLLLVIRRVIRFGIGIGLPALHPDPLFDLNTLIIPRPKFRIQPLTIQDREIYLAGLRDEPEWFQVWSLLSLYTGCRIGEALGFQEHDFDFQARTIHITRQVHKGLVREPKFDSDRTIRMHPELVKVLPPYFEYLTWMRELEDRETYSKWVLPSWTIQEDLPMTPTTIATHYKGYLKRCRLEKRRPHDLRHTVATLLLKSGVDIRTISALLGHSDPSFTVRTYTHVLPEDLNLAIDMLNHVDEKVNCPLCKRPMSIEAYRSELQGQCRGREVVMPLGVPPF